MPTDLDMTTTVEQQILGLDIPMSHTHRVQVFDPLEDLLETAFDLADAHVALLDGSVEVSTGTILHDLAPVMLLVLYEVDSLDDVGVMQGRRDAEFGSELLDVFLFGFVLSPLSKFLKTSNIVF